MSSQDLVDAPAPGRSRRNRGSEHVRRRLVDAAIAEFAARGFEGASTRRIAELAEAHQSQIRYHFDSKVELWQGCLTTLVGELDDVITAAGADDDDPVAQMEGVIRGFVRFAAKRPELNRIMMHEATAPSDRLRWLVDELTGERREQMAAIWNDVRAAGRGAPVGADVLYHSFIGAASLLYANAPEAELFGLDPTDPDLVDRHADALVAMFLPPVSDNRS